jgi:hypothetical protein
VLRGLADEHGASWLKGVSLPPPALAVIKKTFSRGEMFAVTLTPALAGQAACTALVPAGAAMRGPGNHKKKGK